MQDVLDVDGKEGVLMRLDEDQKHSVVVKMVFVEVFHTSYLVTKLHRVYFNYAFVSFAVYFTFFVGSKS